jgi:hypothetical protein
MARHEKEFYYLGRGKPRQDDMLHAPILAGGDHARAKRVSDEVAREAGLTEAQIAALANPASADQAGE